MFLFPGTLAFTDLRESAFVNAPSTNSDCRTSRLLDFEKSECNSGTILSYRGKNVLTTNADYTGGPIELPFSVSYQGHRYFLLDAIDKVHPVYGWVSLRGDAIERELSGDANPICDGGFGGPIALPDPESGEIELPLPHSSRHERFALYALLTSGGLHRVKSGDSTRERSRRDCRDAPRVRVFAGTSRTPIMYTSDITWQEGPVETARYGEGCSDGFWPSPGDACHLRIGGFRYRLGSTVQQQAWAGGTRSEWQVDVSGPRSRGVGSSSRDFRCFARDTLLSWARHTFAGARPARSAASRARSESRASRYQPGSNRVRGGPRATRRTRFYSATRVAERRTLLRTLQPVRRSRRSIPDFTT